MCTIGAKKIGGSFIIFKNRDLQHARKTRIAREQGSVSKLLVTDEKGHCEGFNECGIGVVEAMLQPFPRTRTVPFARIARRILDQKTVQGAVEAIRGSKTSCNAIVSDGESAFAVEKTPHGFAATRIRGQGILTNLSVKLDSRNGSRLASVRGWAAARYARGNELARKAKSLKGIIRLLSDRKGWPGRSICSGGSWWIPTRCSYIFDLEKRTIYFSRTSPGTGSFRAYKLKPRGKEG